MNPRGRQNEVLCTGGRSAGAAEIEKKVFVIAHRAATRRGWVISSLILPSDWLYLAGRDPHHPCRQAEEANCSSSIERGELPVCR